MPPRWIPGPREGCTESRPFRVVRDDGDASLALSRGCTIIIPCGALEEQQSSSLSRGPDGVRGLRSSRPPPRQMNVPVQVNSGPGTREHTPADATIPDGSRASGARSRGWWRGGRCSPSFVPSSSGGPPTGMRLDGRARRCDGQRSLSRGSRARERLSALLPWARAPAARAVRPWVLLLVSLEFGLRPGRRSRADRGGDGSTSSSAQARCSSRGSYSAACFQERPRRLRHWE